MRREKLTGANLTGLAAMLAVVALLGCQGAVEDVDTQERSANAEPRRGSDGDAALERAGHSEIAVDAASEASEGERREGRDDDERAADGDRPDEEMAEEPGSPAVLHAIPSPAASDLEFTEGLPEPPQQQVVPAPAPWTPPSGSDANPKPIIEDVWPDKAPASGGERVVIRGKNLQAAQVVFGLVPARIIDINAAQDTLTVVVPASAAGRVAIVVTNSDGNYALAGSIFQYYD
jgi:hypothetical protein